MAVTNKNKIMRFISYLMLAIISCIFLYLSCNTNDPEIKGETNSLEGLKIVIIDGCEYYQFRIHGNAITHKGNCNNPIHRFQNPEFINDSIITKGEFNVISSARDAHQ